MIYCIFICSTILQQLHVCLNVCATTLRSSVQYTATSAVLLLLKHLELHLSLGCILGFTAPVLSPGRHHKVVMHIACIVLPLQVQP